MDFNTFRQQHTLIEFCDTPIQAFLASCACGNLQLAQTIARNFPNINIHEKFDSWGPDYIFRTTCYHNHLSVAQWLKNTWPSINHAFHDDLAFKHVVKFESAKFAKWIITLYDISTVASVIEYCLHKKYSKLIEYTIRYFEIDQLKISNEFQSKFDQIIIDYQSTRANIKSARHVLS